MQYHELIDRRTLYERAVAVEISERGVLEEANADAPAVRPIRRHCQESVRVAPADGRIR